MFWFTREKVATNAATVLAPIMQAVFRRTGRTDPQLFSNPFLCGFFSGSCFALASVISGRRPTPKDTGDIQLRVLKKLVGQEWKVASDYMLEYMKLADKDCARGSEAAHGLWAVSYGLIDLDSDPLLRTFRDKAKAIPENNRVLGLEPPKDENEGVATVMVTNIVEEIVDGAPWDAV